MINRNLWHSALFVVGCVTLALLIMGLIVFVEVMK